MKLLLGLACLLTLAFAACGGGSNDNKTPAAGTSAPGTTTTAGTPGAPASTTAAASAAGSGTAAGSATAAAGTTPAANATPVTLAQATAQLDKILLKPADLPADWTTSSDTSQDNAAAAAADATAAASNTRCGRLLARTITNMPTDVVGTFISGATVSYFSTATVYATGAGAADCANESAQRLTQPGQLARAFGTLFTDPDSVVVTPVQYPTVADGSFAATLAGKVNANGTIIDLTVLVVAWRQGNVSALVGAAANEAPPTSEIKPYVDLVAQRIAAG